MNEIYREYNSLINPNPLDTGIDSMPILKRGLTACYALVLSGSGTVEDPYVLRDNHLSPTQRTAKDDDKWIKHNEIFRLKGKRRLHRHQCPDREIIEDW